MIENQIEVMHIERMWHEDGDIDDKAFYWLIEQAERVQELEKENKRYREALEFYADKEIYEPVLISEAQCIDGIWVEPAFHEPPTIYFDKGEIARKVLEG